MYKLSVITINYNNKEGLENTVKSVVSQSTPDFEFIIVDGGSTDGSMDTIDKYKSRISKWISEEDKGIYNAMNKGIDMATGEYCLFLNSGDIFYNSKIIQYFISLSLAGDIVYGNLLFTYPNGAKRKGVMPSMLSFRHMMQDTLWHPVSFIKRKLFSTIGKFDEHFTIVSDYDFFVKAILVHKVSTQKINRIIANFKQDGVSASSENKTKIEQERREVQLKYFKKEEIEEALKIGATEKLIKRVKRRIGI